MEHKGTVRIETPRLILRRFNEEDHPAIHHLNEEETVFEFTNKPEES